MNITRVAFRDGHILEALEWTTMILIHNCVGGSIEISLVEVIWKVCASTTNIRIRQTTTLHNALHGFIQGRGTGKATMGANLAKKLAGIVHEPLFQGFIDVRKAYNSLDIGRCMEIIRGYGLGPNPQRLLQRYWDGQKVVPKSGKCFGEAVTYEEKSDTGGPSLTNDLQHRSV